MKQESVKKNRGFSGSVVAVTIQPADRGDCQSLEETVSEALENLESATGKGEAFRELVADRGYHSGAVLTQAEEWGLRSYIAEPKRPRRPHRRAEGDLCEPAEDSRRSGPTAGPSANREAGAQHGALAWVKA